MSEINSSKPWCIYVLRDPRNDEIRYVGFTTKIKRRLYGHINEAHTGVNYKCRWIQSLLRQNLKPIIEVIENGHGPAWRDSECKWIEYYQSVGARLTNSVDGGGGGNNPSEETRQRQRKAKAGKPLSEIHRRNIANAAIGRVQSEETKEKRAAKMRGIKRSDETKRRVGAASKGRRWSEETILKRSNRVRRVEDGEIFISLKAAGRAMNKEHNSITWAIKTGTECAGYHWEYADKQIEKIEVSRYQRVRVRNIDTGETFESMSAAAKSIETKDFLIKSAIERSVICCGYRWEYVDRDIPVKEKKRSQRKTVRVRAIEIDMIFDSIKSAAVYAGIYPSSMRSAIQRGTTRLGYHWEYVDR